MKTLLIVRHGKSSWDYPELSDRDRPLKERGISDAGKMALKLKEQKDIPDLIISSPARRAAHTAEIFSEIFGIPSNEIIVDENLYFQGDGTVIEVVRSLDSDFNNVMIVGHNPDYTDVANHFLPQSLYNLPTAGVVLLKFDCTTWKEISRENLVKDLCLFPKIS